MDNEILRQELRGGWLGIPEPYSLIDFMGAALGTYFIWAGATGRAPRWSLAAIGGVMLYIHVQRFAYAPQTRAGLVNLLNALEVRPDELAPLAGQLQTPV